MFIFMDYLWKRGENGEVVYAKERDFRYWRTEVEGKLTFFWIFFAIH